MAVSARVDEKTNAMLEKTARQLQTTKTEVLRRSITEFCTQGLKRENKSPYELIRDLEGQEVSGRGDLSVRGEEILRERLGRKK
jgi:predicted transcriptional regulator